MIAIGIKKIHICAVGEALLPYTAKGSIWHSGPRPCYMMRDDYYESSISYLELITFEQWQQKMLRYIEDNRGSLIVLICFCGQLTFAGHLIHQNINRSFQSSSSASKAETTDSSYAKQIELESHEYSIPHGHALFFSSRDQSQQIYKVEINSRRNTNGDIVYDISWSDGVKTVYVFWKNGEAEIITKQKNDDSIVDRGSYKFNSKGQLVVSSSTGSYSVFPEFIVAAN